ncbi:MAG: TolC family protein [Alphaproteobacteria bacterium]|jgi:adhesin transport system outer membrane protein|nr:TolC family protein [Alphaproteobacteria bacterium]
MVRVVNLLLILFVSIFFSKSAYSLTVYEVIEKIVNNSPELRVIFEKKNQAVAGFKDQRAQYLPQVYTIFNREYNKNDPITSSADSSWEAYNKVQVVLEQRIFDVEQMTRILSAAQAVQSQEFENQKLLESLIQLAIISYYDVIQSEYLVSINKEYLRQVREIETLTTNMRNQGDATLGDVNLVQSRLASANSNLILAQANLDKTRLRLAYLLNLIDKNQIGSSVAVLPELTNKDFYDLGDKIINMIPLTAEGLINEVLANNIDILILRSNLCLSGYDLEVQKSRYLPVVNLTGELRSEESRAGAGFTRYGKLTFEARYSIYDGGSREAGVKKFSAALKELEYQYDILVRDTSDRSFSTFNLLRSYEQQRLSILKEIEATEEVDRVYNIQFQFASRSLIDRLDNLERLSNARSKLVQIDYSILASRLQVLLLMGNFVEFFGFQNYLETNNLKLC